MNTILPLRRALLAATCALLAGPAAAASVTLTGWAFGSGKAVQATGYNGLAGAFAGTLAGAGVHDQTPFITYCIELEEHFSFGASAMTGYEVVDGRSYFAARRGDAGIADRLGRLMSWAAERPGVVDNASESASLQLAIWNLVYDRDFSLTAGGGSFSDASVHRQHADTLLAGAAGQAASRFEVFALSKAGKQDFLLLAARATPSSTPLSSPGTLLLAGMGLGTIGLTLRRRRTGPPPPRA